MAALRSMEALYKTRSAGLTPVVLGSGALSLALCRIAGTGNRQSRVVLVAPGRPTCVRLPKALPRVPKTDEVRALIRACGTDDRDGAHD
jgi:hypothetical protein